MKHEWKRKIEDLSDQLYGAYMEYATTDTLEPPPGEGWVLTSKFGVGKVKGAGGSPSRTS